MTTANALCPVCDDTGWRPVWCPGDATCGGETEQLCADLEMPHTHTVPCECRTKP